MSEEKKPITPMPDAGKTAVKVTARGVESRYRAGLQFSKEPKEITVDAKTLAALKADPYLQVEVLA